MSLKNLKTLSLKLYGTEVEVALRDSSSLYIQFDGSLKGILVGRIWGEELQEGNKKETVIAVTLNTVWGKKTINSEDILLLRSNGAEIREQKKQIS